MEESDTGAPGIPRNVRVAEVGEDFIVVEWDPPAGGGAASYNVYYWIGGGPEYVFEGVSNTGLRVTDIGDTRERCYRVSAVNAAGVEGEKSETACATVAGGQPPEPEGVEDNCLVEVTKTAVEGSHWSCDSWPPKRYTICLNDGRAIYDPPKTCQELASGHAAHQANLEPGCKYEARPLGEKMTYEQCKPRQSL